jgi:IS30 family transposase
LPMLSKSSFAGISRAQIKRIDAFLDDRPRKCLGWSTPREKLAAFLGAAP